MCQSRFYMEKKENRWKISLDKILLVGYTEKAFSRKVFSFMRHKASVQPGR